jgi:hypothetical protein
MCTNQLCTSQKRMRRNRKSTLEWASVLDSAEADRDQTKNIEKGSFVVMGRHELAR